MIPARNSIGSVNERQKSDESTTTELNDYLHPAQWTGLNHEARKFSSSEGKVVGAFSVSRGREFYECPRE
jgi:hypothetical protein